MKTLSKILIVLLVLLSIPLIGLLFVEESYRVERSVTINQPIDTVFNYIKYLKNQDNYSLWALKDPHMKKDYVGKDGQVGFISKWNSEHEEVGVGEQEIIKITNNKRIDYNLRFKEPFESSEDAYLLVESINGSRTKVIWGFSGKFDYPSNAMLLVVDFEEEIGRDFETGLLNLKKLLEN